MTRFNRTFRVVSIALAAVVILIICGCLRGKEAFFGRYDPATDTFTFTNVVEGLYSDDGAKDYEYVKDLWAKRKDIITLPLPAGEGLRFAILRVSNHRGLLFNPRDSSPPKAQDYFFDTTLDMDDIQIVPGEYFYRGDKVCYYDQFSLQGKFVDQLLEQFSKDGGEVLVTAIDDEIKRRKQGGKVATWDQALRATLREAEDKQTVATTQESYEPMPEALQILTEKSLQRLRTAASDGSLRVKRAAGIFHLSLPLDAADATQAIRVSSVLRQKFVDDQLVLAFLGNVNRKMLADTVTITGGKDGNVDIALDVAKLIPLLSEASAPFGPIPDPDNKSSSKPVLPKPQLEARGIPINAKLTIEEIAQRYGVSEKH